MITGHLCIILIVLQPGPSLQLQKYIILEIAPFHSPFSRRYALGFCNQGFLKSRASDFDIG